MKRFLLSAVCVIASLSVFTASLPAKDFSQGAAAAVPVQDGKPPVIDGSLRDWDLSASEPVYIADQTASLMNAVWAFMYDNDALYVSGRVSLPNRPLNNPNRPQDAFWNGDILQIRLAADPEIPFPLDSNRDQKNDRVAHISLWKNTQDGVDHIHIGRGTKIDLGQDVDPAGSQIVIKTNNTTGYVLEAKIPWTALRVPGGKNPFKVGQRMALVAEALWVGGDQSRIAAIYHRNPGAFAFLNSDTWGQLEFVPHGFAEPRRPTMEQILTKLQNTDHTAQVGVPFTVHVPEDNLKVAVNIVGPKGQVIRELIAGQTHRKGPLTVIWDGTDAWGHAMAPGKYRWAALFHRGLKAEYIGSVGMAGDPPYPTMDDKGGWGGDHSNPLDCAADASGLYFLWPVAEAGRPIVKTDYQGRVIWRKNPFVGGGFGPFYAVASDGEHIYLTLGLKDVRVVRLTAKDGLLQSWPASGSDSTGPTEYPVYKIPNLVSIPALDCPSATQHDVHELNAALPQYVEQPDAVGLAVFGGELFLSSYAQNKILVLEKTTGKVTRELQCAGPRGLSITAAGDLLAASYVPGKAAHIVRYAQRSGTATVIVNQGLQAPYDVSADNLSRLFVSDLGKSQQIKVFDASGSLVAAYGKAGGRAWQGKYDSGAFLYPAGLALDAQGGLLMTESSLPRVCARLDPATGKPIQRWFGPGVYWNSTWSMPDNPTQVFYSLGEGLARGTLGAHPDGQPDVYWATDLAGYTHTGNIGMGMPQPEVVRAKNGETYLTMDVSPRAILLMRDDTLRPVATWRRVGADIKRFPENKVGQPYLDIWIDANGDGQAQPAEQTKLITLANGKPIPDTHDLTGSMHMEPNGDLYFVTKSNSIMKIPASGFSANGLIQWDLAHAQMALPEVLPGLKFMEAFWRHGILGLRLDSQSNLYTVFNTRVAGKGGEYDYATEAMAKKMFDGMGHTSTFNVVKFAKYDPQGNVLWMAGRKAVQGAKPGEIYHFWNLAGLINDRYIAGGSEWGQIYFYTDDGFYVDAIMNNPALMPAPGPYTFGGETSGARVSYFADRDEVWAYSSGMAYKVIGFQNGRLIGEQRASGEVTLDKSYAATTAALEAKPLVIVPLVGNPLVDARLWDPVPESMLKQDDRQLATTRFGYDARNLYGRISVLDDTPMQNSADTIPLAFKGGDSAAIVLGPAGDRKNPAAGDLRIMVANIAGKPRLIAMKPVSAQQKQPFAYTTPASGTVQFDCVGEIKGGQVQVTQDQAGYTVMFAVPRSILEFDLKSGSSIRGDIEIRLSGAGARGLQTTARRYLFTPLRPETTMVDDVPTEARLYPEYWGVIEIK